MHGSYKINATELKVVYDVIMDDHPELFYLSGAYGYKFFPTAQSEEITEVNMISDETQLIVEKADANADKIADALGMDSYIVNDRKKNGSDATLILGKEMP